MILVVVFGISGGGIAFFFFFQAEDGIRDLTVTGVQTCALPISRPARPRDRSGSCRGLSASSPIYHHADLDERTLEGFLGFNDDDLAANRDGQIGRASCRERV